MTHLQCQCLRSPECRLGQPFTSRLLGLDTQPLVRLALSRSTHAAARMPLLVDVVDSEGTVIAELAR
jgi:hypothetical protein